MQGGSWRLLGVQLLACLLTAAWGVLTTVVMFYAIEKTVGIRLTREEELQGCDLVEHGIGEEDHEEDNKGEVDTDAQTEKTSTFRRRTLAVEQTSKFNGLGVETAEEEKSTGSFSMTRLPIVAHILRRKDGTRKPMNNEPSTIQLGRDESASPAKAQMSVEDPQSPLDCNEARVISAEEIRRDNKHARGSDDLRSIYSMESDIEELLRGDAVTTSESCCPTRAQRRSVDKCIQVTCEQGLLLEL